MNPIWPRKYTLLVEDTESYMCKQIKDAFQIKILYRRVDIASPRPAEEVEVEAMGSPSLIQVKEGRGEPEAEQVSRSREEEEGRSRGGGVEVSRCCSSDSNGAG